MARVARSRTIDASGETIWAVVSDAHHLPRWWPRVTRVEDVNSSGWTEVLQTERGRPVRADFTLLEETPPNGRAWAQELSETPFERILAKAETRIDLEGDGQRTRVTLSALRKPRGLSRFGGFMLKRAIVDQLDEALEGLERICAREATQA